MILEQQERRLEGAHHGRHKNDGQVRQVHFIFFTLLFTNITQLAVDVARAAAGRLAQEVLGPCSVELGLGMPNDEHLALRLIWGAGALRLLVTHSSFSILSNL